MRIGFYTSTFNDRPIEEVLDFAKEAGFDAIELDVNGHIRSPDNVAPVVLKARERGLFVCSITFFGNQLDPDTGRRKSLHALTAEFAKAASDASIPVMVIFPGRDNTAPEEENYKSFAELVDGLIAGTPSNEPAFAIENWPGPRNDFVAVTPDGWRQLFVHIPTGASAWNSTLHI